MALYPLALCLLGNFASFFVAYCFFFTFNFFKILSNSLDSDQARHSIGPDLGPNCLQRLSADDTSRQSVKCVGFFLSNTIISIIISFYVEYIHDNFCECLI